MRIGLWFEARPLWLLYLNLEEFDQIRLNLTQNQLNRWVNTFPGPSPLTLSP